MTSRLRVPPSLGLAIAIVVLVIGGGMVSLSVQAWQMRDQRRANATALTGGDPDRGKAVIQRVSCGACHEIPGIDRASGTVGPSLKGISTRAFLAGRLANAPAALTQWVHHPQSIEPGNGMPDPPITELEARDVAAYLYTLK